MEALIWVEENSCDFLPASGEISDPGLGSYEIRVSACGNLVVNRLFRRNSSLKELDLKKFSNFLDLKRIQAIVEDERSYGRRMTTNKTVDVQADSSNKVELISTINSEMIIIEGDGLQEKDFEKAALEIPLDGKENPNFMFIQRAIIRSTNEVSRKNQMDNFDSDGFNIISSQDSTPFLEDQTNCLEDLSNHSFEEDFKILFGLVKELADLPSVQEQGKFVGLPSDDRISSKEVAEHSIPPYVLC